MKEKKPEDRLKQSFPIEGTLLEEQSVQEYREIEQGEQVEKQIAESEKRIQRHDEYVSPEETQHVQEEREECFEHQVKQMEQRLDQPLTLETTKQLHETIVDQVLIELQEQNASLDELYAKKANLEIIQCSTKLLELLKDVGISMNKEEEEEIRRILTSEELLHSGRDRISEILNPYSDPSFEEQLQTRKEEIELLFYSLVRTQLLSKEYKELLLADGTDFIAHKEIEVRGQTVSLSMLQDKEIKDLGIKQLLYIVRQILQDKESEVRHGYLWNTLIPKHLPYVIKTQRKEEYRESVHEMLYYYPLIREVLGAEFLPKQAVLESGKTEEYFVIQEKIESNTLVAVRGEHLEDLFQTSKGKEILGALQKNENKEKLNRFIQGAKNLYSEHGLMVDLLGDNLFMGVNENNALTIVLVDYGCVAKEWDNDRQDIPKNQNALKKLQQLY